jgi:hypothetical protein
MPDRSRALIDTMLERARIEVLRWVLTQFDYPGKNVEVLGTPDRLIIGSPDSVYDQGETPTGIIPRANP